MSHHQAFPEPGHDHNSCITNALANAEAHCRKKKARLTSQRRRILEIIWQSHKPVGAYEILEILNTANSRKAAPMTIYRALDFLMEHGLVHRLASQNAYLGCNHPNVAHNSFFLICSKCGRAGEMENDSIDEAIRIGALQNGFKVENQLVEVEGLCPACGPGQ
ncbi:MAG: Fur family transcriptional regulator [Rhodospirillaceae bacterium]|nr:Fur family transcriptional regulator [Rhodospirillaceae bacterium]|tara:strand:- start:198 stop:686 length:489 start_codon:yes stop_codon:yes gene_type:complete